MSVTTRITGNGQLRTVMREGKTIYPKIGQGDKDDVVQRVGNKEKKWISS